MHKMQVDARIHTSATQEIPLAQPSDWCRVLGAAWKHAAGQQAIEYPNIVRGPTQASLGRRRLTAKERASREASMTNTHATFEPTNSPIRPPCSTHALATAHASKWPSPGCQVPPDFCQATKLCAQLGIHRALQQLGAATLLLSESLPFSISPSFSLLLSESLPFSISPSFSLTGNGTTDSRT